jgi:hypothetical protein
MKGSREKCQFTDKGKHVTITLDLSAQSLKPKNHGAIQIKL